MTVFVDGTNPAQFIPRSSERIFMTVEATGSDETDAAAVPVDVAHTVVSVFADSTAKGVRLADTAQIGDQVQFIRPLGGTDYVVYKPDGSVLSATGAGAQMYNYTPDGWL